jgi:hypothetical protein
MASAASGVHSVIVIVLELVAVVRCSSWVV